MCSFKARFKEYVGLHIKAHSRCPVATAEMHTLYQRWMEPNYARILAQRQPMVGFSKHFVDMLSRDMNEVVEQISADLAKQTYEDHSGSLKGFRKEVADEVYGKEVCIKKVELKSPKVSLDFNRHRGRSLNLLKSTTDFI